MESIHVSIRILNNLLNELSDVLLVIVLFLHNFQIYLINKRMKNIELRLDAKIKENLVKEITEEICEKYQTNL